MKRELFFALSLGLFLNFSSAAHADSVNSPNVTLNADTHRATSTGAGAGNVSLSISTITVAETMLPEYSSGTGKFIVISVRPGYQFDPTSAVTAISANCGINGQSSGNTASVTPIGTANEKIVFSLTSGCSSTVQDIITIQGIKIRIISPEGAAGPAKTTLSITTTAAGGAFSGQGIVAANITKGAHFRMIFTMQPGTSKAGQNLLPEISFADFGNNLITTGANRNVTLSLDSNPGNTFLTGVTVANTLNGKVTWEAGDQLKLSKAANGYVMKATADGSPLPAGNSTLSLPFNITAADPGKIKFIIQPLSKKAGESNLVSVGVFDIFDNLTDVDGTAITLSPQNIPDGVPLLVDSSLTLLSTDGVAEWSEDDNLRINKVGSEIKLAASGLGDPVLSDLFDILPANPSTVRYIQQPSNTLKDQVMSPPVIVQITDEFGNATNSNEEIEVGLNNACGGLISGNSAQAILGIASFSNLTFDTPCAENTFNARLKGAVLGVLSNPFNVSAVVPDVVPTVTTDSCPDDVNKSEAGICGCGNSESDVNKDTVIDCGSPRAFVKNIIPRIVSVTQDGKGKLLVQIEGLGGTKLKYTLSGKAKKFNKNFNANKLFLSLKKLPAGSLTLKLQVTQKSGKKTIKSKTTSFKAVVL